METAEVKSKTRIRHSYPKREIYHRFVHSSELAYYGGSKPIYCIGNCLYKGFVPKYFTGSIEEYCTKVFTHNIIAIIDRTNKNIIINRTKENYWDVYRAIPANTYTVYYCCTNIDDVNIIYNKEELCKAHVIHLIKGIQYELDQCYNVLYTKSNTLHTNVDKMYLNDYGIGSIIKFSKDNNLKHYKWYNEPIAGFCRKIYIPKKPDKYIYYPTLKAICTKHIFNAREIKLLQQYYIYTKYCYGNKISFRFLQNTWNKDCTEEDVNKYFNKIGLSIHPEWYKGHNNWTEAIKSSITKRRQANIEEERHNIEQSQKNYEEAKKQCSNSCSVADWRNGTYSKSKISYRRYKSSHRCNTPGTWVTEYVTVSSSTLFSNIQLKLIGIVIQTSKGVTVPLNRAIELFRYIKTFIKSHPEQKAFTSNDLNKPYINIYALKFVKYTDKITDSGIQLHKKDWLIQIGCHAIWLEEVLEFIHYYNLEKEFGI